MRFQFGEKEYRTPLVKKSVSSVLAHSPFIWNMKFLSIYSILFIFTHSILFILFVGYSPSYDASFEWIWDTSRELTEKTTLCIDYCIDTKKGMAIIGILESLIKLSMIYFTNLCRKGKYRCNLNNDWPYIMGIRLNSCIFFFIRLMYHLFCICFWFLRVLMKALNVERLSLVFLSSNLQQYSFLSSSKIFDLSHLFSFKFLSFPN